MLASSTVENYLKAIYTGAATLGNGQRLLPMGQLAAAVGVAPGTATTMVKALAESGLVEYEPYAGVALTAAGQKLAALVLRRHRLIELFLVRVMGYSWDEVHDEAELLEHVVTDRLIERIDEMLGRPETDPHGDPIPNADGLVKPQDAQTLLSCPLETTVTVTRVIDQDKEFLRFIDKPSQANNAIEGTVYNEYALGSRIQYEVRSGDRTLLVELSRANAWTGGLDQPVIVGWDARDAIVVED